MLIILYSLATSLLCACSDLEGSQQKTNQFFNVDHSTFKILTSQLSTMVFWFYDEDLQQKYKTILTQVVEDIYTKKNNQSKIIFTSHQYSVEAQHNFQQFQLPGLYVIHLKQYIIYDQEIRRHELVYWLLQLLQPQLSQINEPDVSSYLEDSENLQLLIIMSSDYFQFDQIRDTLQMILKNGQVQDVGIQNIYWYNSSIYHEYIEPSLLLKFRNRPPLQYEGDFNDHNAIVTFINQESLPVVYTLTQQVYQRTFQGSIKISLHLLYDEAQENDLLLQQYQASAFSNKMSAESPNERCLFTISTFTQNPEFWSDFGFNYTEKNTPRLVLTEIKMGIYFMLKTIYEGEINQQSIAQFILDYKLKKTQFYYKSEQVGSIDGLIQRSVASDFESKTQNRCLVIAYYSSHPEFLNNYKDLLIKIFSAKVQNLISQITIYQVDILKNEVPAIKIKRVPALMVFHYGQIVTIFEASQLNFTTLKQWIDLNFVRRNIDSDL